MRLADAFYTAALVVLMAWLVLGSLGGEAPGGASPATQAAAPPPAVSSPAEAPRLGATARVDGRSFLIFVGRSPHVWSVAVSDDD